MKSPSGIFLLFLVLLLAGAPSRARAADTTALARSLARLGQAGDWTMEDNLRVYEGDGLFELVDGGAALYLEYGFVRAFALRLARRESRISIEVYLMSGPEAAFGIFSYLAAGSISSAAPFGEQGGRGEGFVLFWKGPYAVTVTTLEGEAPSALDTFALAVDRELPAGGKEPASVTVLRQLGAVDPVFFRGRLGYQKTRGLLSSDLLRVEEGAMGTIGDCTAVVLLYKNADTCRSVLRSALGRIASGARLERVGAGAVFRLQQQIYSLQDSGRRLLQVRGDGRSQVRRLAARLHSAFHLPVSTGFFLTK